MARNRFYVTLVVSADRKAKAADVRRELRTRVNDGTWHTFEPEAVRVQKVNRIARIIKEPTL